MPRALRWSCGGLLSHERGSPFVALAGRAKRGDGSVTHVHVATAALSTTCRRCGCIATARTHVCTAESRGTQLCVLLSGERSGDPRGVTVSPRPAGATICAPPGTMDGHGVRESEGEKESTREKGQLPANCVPMRAGANKRTEMERGHRWQGRARASPMRGFGFISVYSISVS